MKTNFKFNTKITMARDWVYLQTLLHFFTIPHITVQFKVLQAAVHIGLKISYYLLYLTNI